MKKLTVATLVILACAASVMLAQTAPPQPPDPAKMVEHRIKRLTTLLSLTDAQQQQALAIFISEQKGGTTVHEQMRTARQSLDAAVKANNTAGITQAATTIGNLTAQMIADHAKAQAAFYQILTPEQQQKMAEFESEGSGGPHGPGGPGMFMPR